MKKAWLLAAYCVPYVFLAVYGDAAYGTMLLYGAMATGFALLCRSALKAGAPAILYIGNGLSFVSSCLAAKLSGLEWMEHYFKPFTSHSLIVAISLVALVAQTIAVLMMRRRAKKR